MQLRTCLFTVVMGACGGSQARGPAHEPGRADEVEVPWSHDQGAAAGKATQARTPSDSQERAVAAGRSDREAGLAPGPPIDFDVRDTDLHDAFRLLAESADINIVVADSVRGRITLRVRQVPWEQVLHAIANMKRLSVSEEHGIIFLK